MRELTRITCALLLLLLAVEAHGQHLRRLVTIPVEIDGVAETFLIDTGANRTIVGSTLAQHLGLKPTAAISLQRVFSTAVVDMVTAKQLRVGPTLLSDVPLVVEDLGTLSQIEGASISGALGADLLATMTVKLSYSSGTAQVVGTAPSGSSMLGLRKAQDGYFVPVTIGPLTIEMLLDTGTNMTALSNSTWQRLPPEWKPTSTLAGLQSSGRQSGSLVACVPNLRLGENSTNEMMFQDRALRVVMPSPSGIFADTAFAGILGGDILERFEVTLDLHHAAVYLRSDGAFRPDPYEFVTVGIQFFKSSTDAFTVAAVWKHSPAEAAGVRVGDRILSVNGKTGADLNLETFSEQLHGPSGTPIVIEFERAEQRILLRMKTSDLACRVDTQPFPEQSSSLF